MKKSEVKIQGRYRALVSGSVVIVRILGESRYGGWNARNETTGRNIHVRSAQRLRSEVVSGVANLPRLVS